MNANVRQNLLDLRNAVARLDEALDEPLSNRLAVDGTIQRFEFVIELFWKTFKRLLELEQIETSTPREALTRAFQAGWIDDEMAWVNLVKARNQTSHIDNEAAAKNVYDVVKRYFPALQTTLDGLLRRFKPD